MTSIEYTLVPVIKLTGVDQSSVAIPTSFIFVCAFISFTTGFTDIDDTSFDTAKGWQVDDNALKTIVPRAPTHEPYPYHNKGVDVKIKLEEGKPSPPPGAVPVPAGVTIRAK